jgi:transposase, mutator family
VLYIDATYVATRRDGSVSQEAYYSILGLLPDGRREVLSVVHHPEEGALCWEMELEALNERGVEAVDLIVSDELTGIENAVKRAFPRALHQLCTVHFKRNALGMVAKKDRAQLKADLDAVFLMENTDMMPIEAYGEMVEQVSFFQMVIPRKEYSLLPLSSFSSSFTSHAMGSIVTINAPCTCVPRCPHQSRCSFCWGLWHYK